MTTSNSGAFFSFCFGGHVRKRRKKIKKKKEKRKGPAVAGQLWLSGEVTGPLRATLVDACIPPKPSGWRLMPLKCTIVLQ